MFRFTYQVLNSGWADGIINNGEISVSVTASYLHDSLGELADAALELSKGAGSAMVVFMDEPGEHQLLLHRSSDQIFYEVRWFDDWESWGIFPSDKFESLLTGQASIDEFLTQIRSTLAEILSLHGFDGYKIRWIEHDFSIEAFNALTSPRVTYSGLHRFAHLQSEMVSLLMPVQSHSSLKLLRRSFR